MPWVGDINLPFITDKNTSVSRDIVEKNFVDEDPQVYELTPNLEAGAYAVVLNEKAHARNETFEEQQNAVESLVYRHSTECPINVPGDTGYLAVEGANTTTIPSKERRDGEITLRFLDDRDFKSAIVTKAVGEGGSFSPTPEESIIALPSSVQNVAIDGDGTVTPTFTLTTSDGDLDFYVYGNTKSTIEYDLPSGSNYTVPERTSPVRIYDDGGAGDYGADYGNNYGTVGDLDNQRRIYSDLTALTDTAILENGKFAVFPKSDGAELWHWSTNWKNLGTVDVSTNSPAYAPETSNYHGIVDFVDAYQVALRRGYTVSRFTVSGLTEFTFRSEIELNAGTDNSYYYTVSNVDGDEIIIVRTSSDGTFTQDSGFGEYLVSVEGLAASTEYDFFIGRIPGSVTASDYARWIYNTGLWKRNLIQR